MRKGELCGLLWKDVDLLKRTVEVHQQLVTRRNHPWTFGSLKCDRKQPKIGITPETAALLRRHKARQAEMKLQNGPHYRDNGLVFAKEWSDIASKTDTLGEPLASWRIAEWITRIAKLVNVKRITVHGLRHTSATLALEAGCRFKTVQERLGHACAATTLDTYAHVNPGQDQETAGATGVRIHSAVG